MMMEKTEGLRRGATRGEAQMEGCQQRKAKVSQRAFIIHQTPTRPPILFLSAFAQLSPLIVSVKAPCFFFFWLPLRLHFTFPLCCLFLCDGGLIWFGAVFAALVHDVIA